MARRCELTGKGVLSGQNVSHANNKTKRVFRPNLHTVTLQSEALGRSVQLRICMNALRTVDRRGGLDAYLLDAKDAVLSLNARKLKRQIAKRTAESAPAAA